MATYKDITGREYTEEEWNARRAEIERIEAERLAKENEAYNAWKAELIAICKAEIPMFDEYDQQLHFTDGYICDPRIWEGGGDGYQQMTPREYFNAHRALIEDHMRNYTLKSPEELEAMHKAFDESVRQMKARQLARYGAFA